MNEQTSSLRTPTLLQVGGDDHLVRVRSTLQFFEILELEDKTLHIYDGLYQEIYNED